MTYEALTILNFILKNIKLQNIKLKAETMFIC